jgi:hypothetical protein
MKNKTTFPICTPGAALRDGWENAFKIMAENEEDALLDMQPTHFDYCEWEW